MRGVLASWKVEAAQRRRRWPDDPLAAQAESYVSEMESEIARAEEAARQLSVTEYAAIAHTNPATVRRWIQRGELEAERDENGDWRIPRSARRRKPRLQVVNG